MTLCPQPTQSSDQPQNHVSTIRSCYLAALLVYPPSSIYRIVYFVHAHAKFHYENFDVARAQILRTMTYIDVWSLDLVKQTLSAIDWLWRLVITRSENITEELVTELRDEDGKIMKHPKMLTTMTPWLVREKAIMLAKRITVLAGLFKSLREVVKHMDLESYDTYLRETHEPWDVESLVGKLKRTERWDELRLRRARSMLDFDQLATSKIKAKNRVRNRWLLEKDVLTWVARGQELMAQGIRKVGRTYDSASLWHMVWEAAGDANKQMVERGEMRRERAAMIKAAERKAEKNEKTEIAEVRCLEEDGELHEELGVGFAKDVDGDYCLMPI